MSVLMERDFVCVDAVRLSLGVVTAEIHLPYAHFIHDGSQSLADLLGRLLLRGADGLALVDTLDDGLDQIANAAVQQVTQRRERVHVQTLRLLGDKPVDLLA